ncbi:MAG: hypothetical protein ACYC2T_03740 [Bacillota bacterium]
MMPVRLAEVLQRILKYEKGLVRNYEMYAGQVDNTEIARRIKEFARQGEERAAEIEALIKQHCPG